MNPNNPLTRHSRAACVVAASAVYNRIPLAGAGGNDAVFGLTDYLK